MIEYRDYGLQKQHDDLVGPDLAFIINDLLRGYFKERYYTIPIRKPSSYMDYFTFVYYLNDEILDYIYEETYDILDVDWRDLYIIKTSNYDFM